MDNLKFDGSILTKRIGMNGGGQVTGFGLDSITQKPTQSQLILPTIEQRIRDEVEPRAQQAEKDLIAIINIELVKLGINPVLTGTHAYARGIANKYRERLVGERIDALVDFMANIANQ
jgi:hypothetical protein